MEASLAFRRCVRRIPSCSVSGRHSTSAKLVSGTPRQQIIQTSYRTFTTSTAARQDTPPQPQANFQPQTSRDETGTSRTDASTPAPKPEGRIDISSMFNKTNSSSPPPPRSVRNPNPRSASAMIDQLFPNTNRAADTPNRFDRTLRQAGASPYPDSLAGFNDLMSEIGRTGDGSRDGGPAVPDKMPLRLRPTLGRTQHVDPGRGMDLTRAFRTLEVKCSVNGVKRDMRNQRFHVRRGQARKMLRSQRWRIAFKKGFIEECARVRRMKNQGW